MLSEGQPVCLPFELVPRHASFVQGADSRINRSRMAELAGGVRLHDSGQVSLLLFQLANERYTMLVRMFSLHMVLTFQTRCASKTFLLCNSDPPFQCILVLLNMSDV
jgi:hypothetical protein